MKLEQSFTVEAPVAAVWSALMDVQRVAPCLPGAEITEAGDDGAYSGSFTVKLGPTTAAYRGGAAPAADAAPAAAAPPPARPAPPRAAPQPAKPISGFSLFFSVLWERIRRMVNERRGRRSG